MLISPSFPGRTGSDFGQRCQLSQPNATCPVCAALVEVDEDCFSRLFSNAKRVEAASESIVDALGFCPSHGSRLADQHERAQGITRVFCSVIKRLMQWLQNERVAEEKLLPIFLNATKACPACRFRDHATITEFAKLAGSRAASPLAAENPNYLVLCYPHLSGLALMHESAIPDRVWATHFDKYAAAFELLEGIAACGLDTDQASNADFRSTLESVMLAFAGKPANESLARMNDGDCLHASLRAYRTLEESLEDPDICPVCLEVRRTADKWMNSLETAADFSQDCWAVFPTCSEHVWTCLRGGTRKIAYAVSRYIADLTLTQMRRGVDAFAEAVDADFKPLTGTDRQGPRSQAARATLARKVMHVNACCQGCEREALAEDKAIDRLLRLMQEQRFKYALERGHGLCIKHFALAHAFAPKNKIRPAILGMHLDKLESLQKELEAAVREASRNYFEISGASENPSWKRAVCRFSGLMPSPRDAQATLPTHQKSQTFPDDGPPGING